MGSMPVADQPSAGPCIPLSALRPGVPARVCSHPAPRPLPPRLADLGFVAGTPVRVVRAAPLGDPVEIELRGYRVCLRREELLAVCVTPEPAGS
jgi:Fe2+ transport system protein FeoA